MFHSHVCALSLFLLKLAFLSVVVDPIRKRKKELEEERLPEFAPPSSYGSSSAETKQVKLDHTDQEEYQNHSQQSSTSEGHGLPDGQQDKTDGSTEPVDGPFHPLPTPPQNQYQSHAMQQTPYGGTYLYPPSAPYCNQYGGPLPPPQFGPPPPPPNGPIPAYTGCLPPYQFPYFYPPPPPIGVPPSQPQTSDHQT